VANLCYQKCGKFSETKRSDT